MCAMNLFNLHYFSWTIHNKMKILFDASIALCSLLYAAKFIHDSYRLRFLFPVGWHLVTQTSFLPVYPTCQTCGSTTWRYFMYMCMCIRLCMLLYVRHSLMHCGLTTSNIQRSSNSIFHQCSLTFEDIE